MPNVISISKPKFSAISKILLKQLKASGVQNIKLTEVHAMLAKSFGFRSLHDLQGYFDEENIRSIKNDLKHKHSEDNLFKLIFEITLLEQETNDWIPIHAHESFIRGICQIIVYEIKQENVKIDESYLVNLIRLDTLISKILGNVKLFPALKHYLDMLYGMKTENDHSGKFEHPGDEEYKKHGSITKFFDKKIRKIANAIIS